MTDATKLPRAPAGLGRRGGAFWRRCAAAYELTDAETELLIEVCRGLDTLDTLHMVVADQGHTVRGSRGQVIAHPR
jgi:hypothetical protein